MADGGVQENIERQQIFIYIALQGKQRPVSHLSARKGTLFAVPALT
jgi:hypothetical protein